MSDSKSRLLELLVEVIDLTHALNDAKLGELLQSWGGILGRSSQQKLPVCRHEGITCCIQCHPIRINLYTVVREACLFGHLEQAHRLLACEIHQVGGRGWAGSPGFLHCHLHDRRELVEDVSTEQRNPVYHDRCDGLGPNCLCQLCLKHTPRLGCDQHLIHHALCWRGRDPLCLSSLEEAAYLLQGRRDHHCDLDLAGMHIGPKGHLHEVL
mmetsp:Transcript_31714/g.75636  ORF Transcript_31714/g.75636 Transcript_31714/m.75636 type:complete len:211 (-) Transcript_31714:1052-1684(-)